MSRDSPTSLTSAPKAHYFRERDLQQEYTETELKWLEVLSRHSQRETNLKALRKMNIQTDMANHVRRNLAILPLEKRVEFADFELAYSSHSNYRWLPGVCLGVVEI